MSSTVRWLVYLLTTKVYLFKFYLTYRSDEILRILGQTTGSLFGQSDPTFSSSRNTIAIAPICHFVVHHGSTPDMYSDGPFTCGVSR